MIPSPYPDGVLLAILLNHHCALHAVRYCKIKIAWNLRKLSCSCRCMCWHFLHFLSQVLSKWLSVFRLCSLLPVNFCLASSAWGTRVGAHCFREWNTWKYVEFWVGLFVCLYELGDMIYFFFVSIILWVCMWNYGRIFGEYLLEKCLFHRKLLPLNVC